MDWRSIEKDPPEMVRVLTEYDFSTSAGLLLTDGKNVYAGTLIHYNGGYMFEGYDLGEVTDIDNFTIIRFECGENCQWMPMVSAPQKPDEVLTVHTTAGDITVKNYGDRVGVFFPMREVKAAKSAAEMFADLRYVVTRMSAEVTVCDNQKGTSIVINADETGICAAKTIDSYIAGTAACWPGKTLVGAVPAAVTVPLNKAERMAVARLIEEMEDE